MPRERSAGVMAQTTDNRRKTMTMHDIKEMVKDQKKVRFSFYRDGQLWYRTECDFEFPVPIADLGNATLLAEDKAMLFMRYIRKHIAVMEDARQQGR